MLRAAQGGAPARPQARGTHARTGVHGIHRSVCITSAAATVLVLVFLESLALLLPLQLPNDTTATPLETSEPPSLSGPGRGPRAASRRLLTRVAAAVETVQKDGGRVWPDPHSPPRLTSPRRSAPPRPAARRVAQSFALSAFRNAAVSSLERRAASAPTLRVSGVLSRERAVAGAGAPAPRPDRPGVPSLRPEGMAALGPQPRSPAGLALERQLGRASRLRRSPLRAQCTHNCPVAAMRNTPHLSGIRYAA